MDVTLVSDELVMAHALAALDRDDHLYHWLGLPWCCADSGSGERRGGGDRTDDGEARDDEAT
ncbi:hypothetical protein [uncultured Sphingomonas sp.]|uniref:hypothetical protein n=1 Tax=uncultured Sphingomonas sp. TaxID=158754 RepID=UPI0035CC12B8